MEVTYKLKRGSIHFPVWSVDEYSQGGELVEAGKGVVLQHCNLVVAEVTDAREREGC